MRFQINLAWHTSIAISSSSLPNTGNERSNMFDDQDKALEKELGPHHDTSVDTQEHDVLYNSIQKEIGGIIHDPEVPGIGSRLIANADIAQEVLEHQTLNSLVDEEKGTTLASTPGHSSVQIETNKGDEKVVQPVTQPKPGEGFPDGGKTAWLCVLGGWVSLNLFWEIMTLQKVDVKC